MADVLVRNIKTHRRVMDLSQGDLAERMRALGHEWTQTTASDVERGERNVTVDELLGLSLSFGTSPQHLIDPRGIDGRETTPIDIGPARVPADTVGNWVKGEGLNIVTWDGNAVRALESYRFSDESLTEREIEP